jgi:hypothetical protein
MTGCAETGNAIFNSSEIKKPTYSNGCEWVDFLGLSDASIAALRAAQDKPDATPEEKKLVWADRNKIATHDEKWLVNCGPKMQELPQGEKSK